MALSVLLTAFIGEAAAAGPSTAAGRAPKPAKPVMAAVFRPPARPGVHWTSDALVVRVLAPPDVRARKIAQARQGARRAALAEASKRLEGKAQVLPLDADLTVGAFLEKQPDARKALERRLAAPIIIGRRWFSDGGLELWASVSLSGIAEDLHAELKPSPADSSELSAKHVPKVSRERPSGSWIVDARKLAVDPMLWVHLIAPDGHAIGSPEGLAARWCEDAKRARSLLHGRVRTVVARSVRDGALVVSVPKGVHPPRHLVLLVEPSSKDAVAGPTAEAESGKVERTK